MNNEILKRLNTISSIGLTVAAIIFLCLPLFGYEGEWALPAALACTSVSLLFQTVLGLNENKTK